MRSARPSGPPLGDHPAAHDRLSPARHVTLRYDSPWSRRRPGSERPCSSVRRTRGDMSCASATTRWTWACPAAPDPAHRGVNRRARNCRHHSGHRAAMGRGYLIRRTINVKRRHLVTASRPGQHPRPRRLVPIWSNRLDTRRIPTARAEPGHQRQPPVWKAGRPLSPRLVKRRRHQAGASPTTPSPSPRSCCILTATG